MTCARIWIARVLCNGLRQIKNASREFGILDSNMLETDTRARTIDIAPQIAARSGYIDFMHVSRRPGGSCHR